MKENKKKGMNIEALCNWTDEAIGLKSCSQPSADFWANWRLHKDEMKAAGIKVKPGPDKSWIATWTYKAAPLNTQTVTPQLSSAPPPRVFIPTPAESVASLLVNDDIPWTVEQKAIFEKFQSHPGNIVIRARAGSGKTTTSKKAFEFSPAQFILYVVYNKKNAREAQAKIRDPRVEIRTLNSVGFRCILRVWSGMKPDDSVEHDRILAIVGQDCPDEVRGILFKFVTWAKNVSVGIPELEELEEMADVKDFAVPEFESEAMGGWNIAKLAVAAQGVLELSKHRDEQGRIAWADQVWLAVAMNWVRPQYDDVLVDECQDMSLPQLVMARRLVRKDGRCICVGDDRQCIYTFRGATTNGLDLMKKELQAIELGLTVTQRNPKAVVELAKEYVPDFKAAENAIEGQIDRIGESKLPVEVKVGDAVLSRSNAALMPLCLSVLKRGVRARIEGKDIGKALIALVNNLKAKSVPDFIGRVEAWKEKSIARAMKRPQTAEEKCESIRDQADTLCHLADGMASVDEIRVRIATLFENADENPQPAVIFSTVHKAKGLEWDRVFVISETFLRRKCTEEENIYYVAITRARKNLVFVRADGGAVANTSGTK